jgi:hypothetical protein
VRTMANTFKALIEKNKISNGTCLFRLKNSNRVCFVPKTNDELDFSKFSSSFI